MKLKLFFSILLFYACIDDDQIFIENLLGIPVSIYIKTPYMWMLEPLQLTILTEI